MIHQSRLGLKGPSNQSVNGQGADQTAEKKRTSAGSPVLGSGLQHQSQNPKDVKRKERQHVDVHRMSP
jgi:hypothetical protein